MRRLNVGDRVSANEGPGMVIIAEGQVVWVDLGCRVARYECREDRWQRDYLENGVPGHDELHSITPIAE